MSSLLDEANEVGIPLEEYVIRVVTQPKGTKLAYAEYIGVRCASNSCVIKMDGDGQHPFNILHEMVKSSDSSDIIIASRYSKGGGSNWQVSRSIISRTATFICKVFIKSTRGVADPLSGLFLISKDLIPEKEPYKNGFKYLLFVLSKNRSDKITIVPYYINKRQIGNSKITTNIISMVKNFIIEVLYDIRV